MTNTMVYILIGVVLAQQVLNVLQSKTIKNLKATIKKQFELIERYREATATAQRTIEAFKGRLATVDPAFADEPKITIH